MKKKLLRGLGAVILWQIIFRVSLHSEPALNSAPVTIRVMSYNIRTLIWEEDLRDLWWFRRSHLAELIRSSQPDLIGMQEVNTSQANYLAKVLPEYAWFGPAREDGKNLGERCPIFYKKSRLELLAQNTFWLSEAPEVAGSKSWDTFFPRIVTWGKFQERESGRVFYFFNTHFDHQGKLAREQSARLLAQRVEAIAGALPAVVVGDFNFTSDSLPYQTLAGAFLDSRKISQTAPIGPENTAWDFKPGTLPDKRIDYIFVSKGIVVNDYSALAQTYGKDRRPSDHIPILATITIP